MTGLGATITLVNVEDLTVNSLGGNDTLSATEFGGATDLQNVVFNSGGDASDTFSLTGTANQDDIQVTPQSATTVTAQANGVNPLLTVNLAAAASSTFTVSGGGERGRGDGARLGGGEHDRGGAWGDHDGDGGCDQADRRGRRGGEPDGGFGTGCGHDQRVGRAGRAAWR